MLKPYNNNISHKDHVSLKLQEGLVIFITLITIHKYMYVKDTLPIKMKTTYTKL